MGLFEQFPYTNMHELNLDWLLKKMRELELSWGVFKNDMRREWDKYRAGMTADWNAFQASMETRWSEWKTAAEADIRAWETQMENEFNTWKNQTLDEFNAWKIQMVAEWYAWKTQMLAEWEAWKTQMVAEWEAWKTAQAPVSVDASVIFPSANPALSGNGYTPLDSAEAILQGHSSFYVMVSDRFLKVGNTYHGIVRYTQIGGYIGSPDAPTYVNVARRLDPLAPGFNVLHDQAVTVECFNANNVENPIITPNDLIRSAENTELLRGPRILENADNKLYLHLFAYDNAETMRPPVDLTADPANGVNEGTVYITANIIIVKED